MTDNAAFAEEGEARPAYTDRRLAVIIGPGHWLGVGQPITTPMYAIAAAHIVSLITLGTTVTLRWIDLYRAADRSAVWYVIGTWVAVAFLATPLALRLIRPTARVSLPLPVTVLLRVSGLVFLAAMPSALMVGWTNALLWPICVFAGADVALTLRALGHASRLVPSLPEALLSPMHVGIVAGLVLIALLPGRYALGHAFGGVLVTTETFFVVGYLFVYLSIRLFEHYDVELATARRRVFEAQQRGQAHWIHDDVLAELRLVRLRLERGELDQEELLRSMEEVEHHLRVRQLDTVVQSGTASVAEILQPYLRMAASSEIALDRVPSYEVGRWKVGQTTGMALKRCFAVPVTNAIVAGATRLSVGIRREGQFLEVDVEDDAGGYEPSELHAGRGLQVLHRELAPGVVTVTNLGGGTRVRCRVPLLDDDRLDRHADRALDHQVQAFRGWGGHSRRRAALVALGIGLVAMVALATRLAA